MFSTSTTTRGRYEMVDSLDRDWAYLVESSPARVRSWALRHQPFSGCVGLDDVMTAIRDDPDGALSALLSDTSAGDQLAGRVVLQTMLGKIVRMVSRDDTATSDDYVVAMWCRIRTYPLATRPRRVAANLALDTLKAVRRSPDGYAGARGVDPMSPDEVFDQICSQADARHTLDHNAASHVSGLQLIRTAAALGLIAPGTSSVLHSVYIDGLAGRDAATRHSIAPTTVRFRCSRGVRKLAEHAEVLLDAA